MGKEKPSRQQSTEWQKSPTQLSDSTATKKIFSFHCGKRSQGLHLRESQYHNNIDNSIECNLFKKKNGKISNI